MGDGPLVDLAEPTLGSTIVVPEGSFSAPKDFEIQKVQIRIGKSPEVVPLIKQTFAGNCAEYTSLDTAIILSKIGVDINGAVDQYLREQPKYGLLTVENDLTIPLILKAQKEIKTKSTNGNQIPFPVKENDVDNLVSKYTNPYEPLTNTNSALLFREIVSPKDTIVDPTDFTTEYNDATKLRLLEPEVQAVFIGSEVHATSIVKLGGRFLHIDPYHNPNIIQELTAEEAQKLLQDSLSRPHSFATFNDVRMK